MASGQQEIDGGHEAELFVNIPSDEIICGLCFEVFRNPHQCFNGHSFCKKCILSALAIKSSCPICRCDVTASNLQRNVVINNKIDKLLVYCHSSTSCNNCSWIGSLKCRVQHEQSCGFVLVNCSNDGCSELIRRCDFLQHVKDECSLRKVFCVACNVTVICDEMEQHNNHCVSRYTGEFKKGLRHGRGKYFDEDGSIYEGSWKHDMRHGEGIELVYENGILRHRYEGSFKVDMYEGYGEMQFPHHKELFCGEFKENELVTGTRTDKDGTIYNGEFSAYRFHGQGTRMFADGDCYKGGYVNGLMKGQGVLLRAVGVVETGTFDEFHSGYYVSNGVLNYPNEYVFTGDYHIDFHKEANYVFDKGSILHPDTARYDGDWLYDAELGNCMHGHGTLIETDGSSYTGQWMYDKRNGYGELSGVIDYGREGSDGIQQVFRKTSMTYKGDWKDDKRHGKAIVTLSYQCTSKVYIGDFVDNQCHGRGVEKYISPKGTAVYGGDFVSDNKQGQGKMKYRNGDVYQGGWLNDQRHGLGTLTNINGDVYEGMFLNDLMHGHGKYTSANGDVYEGEWKDNMKLAN